MDPSVPPSDESALVGVSDSAAENALASAGPLWLYRTYLGIGGLAIAQVVVMVRAAGTILELLAMRAENRPLERLFNWIWHLQDVAYAIQWFSALYLLALTRYSAEREDPFRSSRKLLLYVGCAWVIIRFIPMIVLPLSVLRVVGGLAEIAQIAAVAVLFLYLMKIAELANDAFLKLHLPFAMILVILTHGLTAMLRFRMDQIETEDLRLLLMLASSAYWLYLMLRMRAMLAKLIFTNSPQEP